MEVIKRYAIERSAKLKKTISAMLAAVLLLSLTACGGNNNNSDNNSSSAINADGSRETYVTFKVGTSHNAESFFYAGLAEFERLVEENTKGAVQVEVFADEALAPRVRWLRVWPWAQ